jgi:DNA-binding LytR/AlgR family response regulator
MSFSGFEGLLPESQFIRVHRSFIVSMSKIGHIEGNRVFIGEQEIPIGDNYREEFFRRIGIDQK